MSIGPRLAELRARRDLWLGAALLLMLVAVSVAAAIALARDTVLAFADAPNHVLIARRIFDNREVGLAQLGVYWLPLLHVLQVPFVAIEPLYRSGASGTIVSAAASLVTALFVYRLALLVGASRSAAFVAVAMLVAAPSFLYVSVVPMHYAIAMATATGSIYLLTRWAVTERGVYLLAAGLLLTLTTLTHFDTWVLWPMELGVVALIAWRRRFGRVRSEATVILWALAGTYGIALFFLMNVAFFGEPFAFTKTFVNPPLLDAARAAGEAGGGGGGGGAGGGGGGAGLRLGIQGRDLGAILSAVSVYPRAAILLAGPVLAAGGAVGAALYAWRWRRDLRYLIPLLLFYPLAFYSIYAGVRSSLITAGDEPATWVNLRYADTIYPALAFFLAVGIRWTLPRTLIAAVAAAAALASIQTGDVAAWQEGRAETERMIRDANVFTGVTRSERRKAENGGFGLNEQAGGGKRSLREAGEWLGARAGGDTILIPVHHFLVDRFEVYTDLPLDSFIDANDGGANDAGFWQKARSNPARSRVRWIAWIGELGRRDVPTILDRAGTTDECYLEKVPAVRIYAVAPRSRRDPARIVPGSLCRSFGAGGGSQRYP